MRFHMQSQLCGYVQKKKEFPDGSPLKELFHKKVRTSRVKKHIELLFDEKVTEKVTELEKEIILQEPLKNGLKQLRFRGYTILEQ